MADDDIPRSANGRKNVVLTGNTLLPLGAVIAIVLALWRGTTLLNDRFDQLAASDRLIAEQLMLIKLSTCDRWSATAMKLWAQQLKIENPTLAIPDVSLVMPSENRTRDTKQ